MFGQAYALYNREITYKQPIDIPDRYLDGERYILTAFGCVLTERRTEKSYVYSVVNLSNGRKAILCRSEKPLDFGSHAKLVQKIYALPFRDVGRYEADRPSGDRLPADKLNEILNHVFKCVLPQHGYKFRENQLGLSEHMLETITRKGISLAESEVGTGKTLAYLVAAVLAKRGRFNDSWLRGNLPGQSYAEGAYMPVVIATSSIALQKALVTGYIPDLSRILMAHHIIRTPLTCVIRKGKEHYLCEARLRTYYADADIAARTVLGPLLSRSASCDLSDADGLTPYMKRQVCVGGRCATSCRYRDNCRYVCHIQAANDSTVDFQVTNHNYFLADIAHRRNKKHPLLPHYQLVIMDEAHKFLTAARQMYGLELSDVEIPRIADSIHSFADYMMATDGSNVHRLAKKLAGQSKRLFKRLRENTHSAADYAESGQFPAVMDAETARHLKNIAEIAGALIAAMEGRIVPTHLFERKKQAVRNLGSVRDRALAFRKYENLICWIEQQDSEENSETILRAIPKELSAQMYADIWNMGIPFVLTSGTLSAFGDFTRTKQTLGIDRMDAFYVQSISLPSPFDYKKNTLLYLSEQTLFPNNHDKEYISSIADEVERLTRASLGHAAVLFTSYNVLGQVYAILKERYLPYPLFRMGRRDTSALDQFKTSGNGVLFASGALWEGVDVPGDALSMLIIVKLPFAAPDPIGDYERSLFGSTELYKVKALIPDMLVKLKQGFGRLIRTETDTGVCAILDCRAGIGVPRNGVSWGEDEQRSGGDAQACVGEAERSLRGHGTYHRHVLKTLPPCEVTSDTAAVEQFIREFKPQSYFAEEAICEAA
ncbi:MAG: ATP-dependent DNA helicase [Clostridiales bacterium]|nr:ATP-dependent DNA helicase [Clostridiales bacterium]